jgi:RNA recognition motif-containing protein
MMPSQNTNIYLKNFPSLKTEVLEQTLRTYCARFGSLSSMLIKPYSDLSLPFAFVCFESKEQAQQCFEELKVNPPYPNLYANWAESRQERNKKLKSALSQIQNETNLFVKNLKQSVSRETLLERMAKYGQITSCEVKLPDMKGQQSIVVTKFGFVNFKNKEDARNALLMAREQQEIKDLFQDGQLYINFHLLKSQSASYQNMRKNKLLVPNMIQSMPQMMYPQFEGYARPHALYPMQPI